MAGPPFETMTVWPAKHGGRGVREVRAHERPLPQQAPGRRVQTHELPLRQRNDLARAVQLGDDRRSIPGAVAFPAPFLVTRVHVERRERALIVPTHVEDNEAAFHERREGMSGKGRYQRRPRFLPDLFAGGSVERRHDPRHADREQPAICKHRRGFRPRAVPRRATVHAERGGITRLPEHRTRAGVERAHDLVSALAREHVDPVSHDERRGVAEADLDLPAPGQLLRPLGGRRERGRRAVTVRSPPLWPVSLGRGGRGAQACGNESGRQRASDNPAKHRCCSS